MIIETRNDITTIWLTNADQADSGVQDQVDAICARCRSAGTRAVIFRSGSQDLYANTLALLSYNRRRCAEREVQSEKQGRTQETSR